MDPLHFLPPPVPGLPLLLHSCFTHSLPYSSCFSPSNSAKRSVKAMKASHSAQRKMAASSKSWRGSNTLGLRDLRSWRERDPRVPRGGCAYGSTPRWSGGHIVVLSANTRCRLPDRRTALIKLGPSDRRLNTVAPRRIDPLTGAAGSVYVGYDTV